MLWDGLGVVDGRVILDLVTNGPQPMALLIDWAGRTQWATDTITDTITVAGDTATVAVPLVRDQHIIRGAVVPGRWHLADPAGTQMRSVPG